MAYYILNLTEGDATQAARLLQARMWGVGPEEPHSDALGPGDLALVYLAAPERMFVARVRIGSAVRGWTASEAQRYPGDAARGVLLDEVAEWDPPVPMSTVLAQIDRSAGARADFDLGVVRITGDEYETALAIAAGRLRPTPGSS